MMRIFLLFFLLFPIITLSYAKAKAVDFLPFPRGKNYFPSFISINQNKNYHYNETPILLPLSDNGYLFALELEENIDSFSNYGFGHLSIEYRQLNTNKNGFIETIPKGWVKNEQNKVFEYFTFKSLNEDFLVTNLIYTNKSWENSTTNCVPSGKATLMKNTDYFNASFYEPYLLPVELDYTPPIIKGPDTIQSFQSNPLSKEVFLNLFHVEDNVSSALSVMLKTDFNFSEQKTVGIYPLLLSAIDENKNKFERIVHLEVVDDLPPQMNYPKHITLSNFPYSIEDFTNYLTILDKSLEIKNLTITKENYSKNQSILGTYSIKYDSCDQINNCIKKETLLQVAKFEKKFISYDFIYYKVNDNISLSFEDIKHHWKDETIELIENDYYGNETKSGIYYLILKKQEILYTITIEVIKGDRTFLQSCIFTLQQIINSFTSFFSSFLQ